MVGVGDVEVVTVTPEGNAEGRPGIGGWTVGVLHLVVTADTGVRAVVPSRRRNPSRRDDGS